jgi:DNA helicase-2/ATP-dependent DNA helicase PcrA
MKTVFQDLNPGQRAAVELLAGPVLIIAGPGSGKTLTLVRRVMNVLLSDLARPEEIVLCTFTEKAALELRDRVRKTANDLGYTGDMSGLRVGTLHGIAHEFVDLYRHRTPLASNFEVLDDLTQKLFLYDKFSEIVPEQREGKYFGSWATKWSTIDFLLPYFDKITEELINPQLMLSDPDPFVCELGAAYIKFEEKLWENNKVDFSHLQKLFIQILRDPEIGTQVISTVKYVMVDEYQDTNYIQEQIVKILSSSTANLCVVGDEDQSLYRFRGATVRNILEFAQTNVGCQQISLEINYRSHREIVSAYNSYMQNHDWANGAEPPFRFDKRIVPHEPQRHSDYPSVISIWGKDKSDEAKRFADLVAYLKDNDVITDYSQVALLLYSVKEEKSRPFMDALEARGIKSFCPRARAFFSNDEIKLMVAALAAILDWNGENRGENLRGALLGLSNYVDECYALLAQYRTGHPLLLKIQKLRAEVEVLKPGKALDRRISDYLYQFMSVEPFNSLALNANRARNLALFSQLTSVFGRYYNYTVLSEKNLPFLRGHFFASFLRFLHSGGINEYEDPDQPFPKDHVQIMTIHQSKGLEFPVVVVGSLTQNISTQKKVDQTLSNYYAKVAFEPETRITGFDRMRLHYVAFSRAEKLLVLTNGGTDLPKDHFSPIWDGLPQWPAVSKELIASQEWTHQDRIPPKKSYSFTGDLKVYETCPRQYQMYKYLEFAPSRTVMVFFGLLVHQTIEDIHRLQLDGKGDTVNEQVIEERFDFNYRHLLMRETRQIGEEQKKAALKQVINYWKNNKVEITRVIETEIDVTLEKEGYILNGAIDLVMSDDGSLDVLDFKAQSRPPDESPSISTYYKQLCIYAHLLEKRSGRQPDRLVIYWTGEEDKSKAVMSFAYDPKDVEDAVEHFDEVVREIQSQNFLVTVPPDTKVCAECDFKSLCESDGTIHAKGRTK